MGAYEPRDLTSPEKLTFFVPSTNPQVPVIGMTSRRNDWPGADLDPDDFEIDDLLLMQDPDGCYWWAFFDSIFEQDSKMYLHRCALNHVEADSIVRRRVLFVSDNDSRLSDFTLLCQHGKPPTADKTSDKFDVAARHLASTREVHIFSIGPDGKRACDEIKTADYCRAKADIRRNPADMRNMRRFCNRQWNGEGPSNLNRRICHGYVPPRTRWSPSSSPEASRTPSLNYFSSSDMPYIEIPTPEQRHRRHSTTYYFMKRTLVPNTKLKAHQYNYDLKHARREKKPEEYLPPSRWSAVVKRIWRFCRSAQRRLFVEATSASAHLKGKRRPGARYESQKHPSPPPPDHPSSNKSYERSTSPTLVDDEDISPFTLGAPAMEHIPPPRWVERDEIFAVARSGGARAPRAAAGAQGAEMPAAFPRVEILDGVPGPGDELRAKKDSLGEGITGACESKAPFVDPGVSTVAGTGRVKRNWVGDGGWKWIFNEGMG